METRTNIPGWRKVELISDDRLFEARGQLHQAAQFLSAAGISYLPPKPDDSHTALMWSPTLQSFFSPPFGDDISFQLSLDPVKLVLKVHQNKSDILTIHLHGNTLLQVESDLRFFLEHNGLPANHYSLKRHYELPEYQDRTTHNFDVSDQDTFQTLTFSYVNAYSILAGIIMNESQAGDLLTWPHHFDMATLITRGEGRSIGIGLSPGDESYPAPYYYINSWPYPIPEQIIASPLRLGHWHKKEWTGMVLTLEEITTATSAEEQKIVVDAFISEALAFAKAINN